MPKRHSPGGCGCCNCWNCDLVPETVAIEADTYAGECCQYPAGTYVTSPVGGFDFWDEDLHELVSGSGHECFWSVRVGATGGSGCTIVPPYIFTGSADPGMINFVAKCEENDLLDSGSNVIGEYWVTEQVRVCVKWANSPRRIIVVIARLYAGSVCSQASSNSPDLAFSFHVYDTYEATDLECDALPETINHTARYVTWVQHETGTSGNDIATIDYGYNPASPAAYDLYTFTPCAANVSVSLTYV